MHQELSNADFISELRHAPSVSMWQDDQTGREMLVVHEEGQPDKKYMSRRPTDMNRGELVFFAADIESAVELRNIMGGPLLD